MAEERTSEVVGAGLPGHPDEAVQGTFEELYDELEATVRKLEAGDLSLADSVALFERSTILAEHCNALLDHAELRVRLLTLGPDGSLDTQPF